MKRLLVRIGIPLVAALALAIVGVVIFRTAVAEIVLHVALRGQGFVDPSLRVRTIDLNRIVVEDFSLGAERALSIRQIVARFAIDQLLQGRLSRVDIHDLRASAEVTFSGLAVDGLPLPSAAEDTETPPQVPIEMLALHNARVVARTPLGNVDVHLDGMVRTSKADTALEAAFDYAVSAAEGTVSGDAVVELSAENDLNATVRIASGALHLRFLDARDIAGYAELRLEEGRVVEASARLDTSNAIATTRDGLSGEVHIEADYAPDGGRAMFLFSEAADEATVWIDLTIDETNAAPRWDLAAVIELEADSALWQTTGLPPPTAGQASVEIESQGRLPSGSLARISASKAAGRDGIGDILARTHGAASFDLRIADADHPSIGRGLHAEMALGVETRQGGLTLSLERNGVAGAASLAPDLLRRFGAQDFAGVDFAQGLSLGLQGSAERPFRIFVQPNDSVFDVGLAGTLIAQLGAGPALEAEAAGQAVLERNGGVRRFDLPFVRVVIDRLPISGAADLNLRATGAVGGTLTQITGRTELDMDATTLKFAGVRTGAASLRVPLRFEVSRLASDAMVTTVRLDAPGRFAARDVALPDGLGLEGPVHLALLPLDRALLDWRTGASEPAHIEHTLGIRADTFEVTVPMGDYETHRVRFQTPAVDYHGRYGSAAGFGGEANGSIASVSAPDFALIAESVAGRVTIESTTTGVDGALTVDALRHESLSPWFAPLGFSAKISLIDQLLRADAVAHESATGTKRFAANGQYSFLIKSGRTTVTVAPLTFAVGGLQPADLVPRLGILEAVSGGIAAEMSAYFGPDSLKTFGNV